MRPGLFTSAALFGVILLAGGGAGRNLSAAGPKEWLNEQRHFSLVELYHEFHQAPELSLHEEQTAAKLAAELEKVGAEVTTGIGGHGVAALLKNGEGPTVMVRCDLDALPVVEETGLPFASKVKTKNDAGVEVGVMHACGHDIHITNVVGVARYLADNKDAWQGTVMFIGQPAEEYGAGARNMLNDGLFKKVRRPDFALAVHVDATLAAGRVGYRAGYALANVDSVDITVRGRGGHGAHPNTTVDPIVQAARLILDLQTIVSREINPLEPSVITVGSIHGGTKHNIIGDTCHLQITVRSYSPKVRQQLLDAIKRKANAAAASANGPEPIIKVSDGTPAMFNDEALTSRLVPVFAEVLGEDNVVRSEQSMGGEDFSEFGLAGVPICMYRLGAVDAKRLAALTAEAQGPPSLHSPKFYPDAPEVLKTGLITMSAAVCDLLPPKKAKRK